MEEYGVVWGEWVCVEMFGGVWECVGEVWGSLWVCRKYGFSVGFVWGSVGECGRVWGNVGQCVDPLTVQWVEEEVGHILGI